MRTRLLLIVPLVCGLVIGTSSCVNLDKIREYPAPVISAANGIIPSDGRNADINLLTVLDDSYSYTNTGIRVEPLIEGAGRQLYLPPFVIEGRNNKVFNARTAKLSPRYTDSVEIRSRYGKGSTEERYSASVPVEEWMHGAAIYADVYADAYTKSVYLGRARVGCIPDLAPFIQREPDNRYFYSTSASKERTVQGGKGEPVTEGSEFRVNSSELNIDGNADRSFRDHFKRVSADPEVASYSVDIFVSNSPDGSLDYNRQLGQKRIETMLAYAESAGIPRDKCRVSTDDEGWDALLAALPSLGLENRADIEQIIRSTPDLDEREKLIRKEHYADYRIIHEQVYPSLRRGDITLSVTYKGEPGREYRHTFATSEDAVHSFVLADGSQQDIMALHRAMLDAVKAGDMASAEKYADRIPNPAASDIVRLNKANVYIHRGRKDEAKALLKTVPHLDEARYNLGTLQLLDREYAEAERSLEGIISRNTAIADICTDRNGEAVDNLLLLDKSAERDYLLAVAYARLGRTSQASSYLSSALAASPVLRDYHAAKGENLISASSGEFERAPAVSKTKKAKEPRVKEPKEAKQPKEPKTPKEPKVKEPKPEKVKEPKAAKEPRVKEPNPEKEPKVKAEKEPKVKEPKTPKEPKVKAEKVPKEKKQKETREKGDRKSESRA